MAPVWGRCDRSTGAFPEPGIHADERRDAWRPLFVVGIPCTRPKTRAFVTERTWAYQTKSAFSDTSIVLAYDWSGNGVPVAMDRHPVLVLTRARVRVRYGAGTGRTVTGASSVALMAAPLPRQVSKSAVAAAAAVPAAAPAAAPITVPLVFLPIT